MEFKSFKDLQDQFIAERDRRIKEMNERAEDIKAFTLSNPESIIARMMSDAAFYKMMEALAGEVAKVSADARTAFTHKEPLLLIISNIIAGYEVVSNSAHHRKVRADIDDVLEHLVMFAGEGQDNDGETVQSD